jgi:hypothetical protein
MAGGWPRDGALQDRIDDTVRDAVLIAHAGMPFATARNFVTIAATISRSDVIRDQQAQRVSVCREAVASHRPKRSLAPR